MRAFCERRPTYFHDWLSVPENALHAEPELGPTARGPLGKPPEPRRAQENGPGASQALQPGHSTERKAQLPMPLTNSLRAHPASTQGVAVMT
jgi:hypothetical protein